MSKRFLLAITLAFAWAAPSRADQILGAPRITSGSNAVVLPGGPTLGKWQANKYIATPDTLTLPSTDQGSTGDASGLSATGNGVTVPLSKLVLKGPSIVDRGAVGDWNGTTGTNNTAAVQAQLTNECVIRVPAGVYRVTSALTTTCNNVVIEGTGILSSKLVFDNPAITTGITINSPQLNEKTGVEIRNVSIMTTQTNVGTAVSITHPPNIGAFRSHLRLIVDNVQFAGVDISTKSWNVGLALHDVLNAKFVSTSWIGSSTSVGTGLTIGVSNGNEASPYIFTGCDFWYMAQGIDASGWTEGIAVTDGNFVNVGGGIKFVEGGPGGFLSVKGTHMSVFGPAIYLSASGGYLLQQVEIEGNLFFQSLAGAALLDFQHTINGNVHDNQLWSFVTGAIGINFHGQVQAMQVHDNKFVSGVGSNFAWGATFSEPIGPGNSVRNRFYNNSFEGTYVNGTIQDTMTAGYAQAISYGNVGASVVRNNSAQSFGNGAGAAFAFDTVLFDGIQTFNAVSGAVTIPAASGIRRARVCASVNWDSGTGLREIKITKNGATSVVAGQSSVATGGNPSYQSTCTNYMAVAEGDSFYLLGLQVSGAALNANNATLSIEAMP